MTLVRLVSAPGPDRSQVAGERRLWSAVLWQMIFDLALADRNTRRDAEQWIGARPTRDFVLVCDFCGIDPAAAHQSLREILALPWEARNAHMRGALGLSGYDNRRAVR